MGPGCCQGTVSGTVTMLVLKGCVEGQVHTDLSDMHCQQTPGIIWVQAVAGAMSGSMTLLQPGSLLMSEDPVAIRRPCGYWVSGPTPGAIYMFNSHTATGSMPI